MRGPRPLWDLCWILTLGWCCRVLVGCWVNEERRRLRRKRAKWEWEALEWEGGVTGKEKWRGRLLLVECWLLRAVRLNRRLRGESASQSASQSAPFWSLPVVLSSTHVYIIIFISLFCFLLILSLSFSLSHSPSLSFTLYPLFFFYQPATPNPFTNRCLVAATIHYHQNNTPGRAARSSFFYSPIDKLNQDNHYSELHS